MVKLKKHPNELAVRDVEGRKRAGRWLKQLRLDAGYTQSEMQHKLGLNNYSFISALEAGTSPLPPNRYGPYADALGQNRKDFALTMLEYTDPELAKILKS